MQSAVTKVLPDTLDYKSPPILDINSGDTLQLTIGKFGSESARCSS